MNATYLERASLRRQHRRTQPIKAFLALVLAVVFMVLTVGGALGASDRRAEAFDPIQWAMCYFGDDSPTQFIYQSTQTSDIPFEFLSKSAITGGVDNVDQGLNWLLGATGTNFADVNEPITGYRINPIGEDPDAATGEAAPLEFNGGVAVNPFDRFGVAGLNFTAYSGEWKHVIIDACAVDGSEPRDPKAGVFYENRLEPQSTWEDIPNSADVRTIQFDKGVENHWSVAIGNLLANWIFNITKTVVALTVALIGFAFTDIVSVVGLTSLLAGEGGSIFAALFSGIYLPLIVVAFTLTGFHIFYLGIVKKQYRGAVGTLLRSLLLFFIAFLVAAAPAFFISLPNTVAITGQALIVGSLNTGLSGGGGLCSTNVGQFTTQLVTDPNATEQNILNQASANVQSSVGCQFWQMFLLRPWVQGQFGTEWNNLWVKDKQADWAPSGASQLANVNTEMVGEAGVPLGAGTMVHNWALFQLSTQTNVHTPVAHEGERSKFTSGVANDWWRIVDALSNYGEEKTSSVAQGNGPNNVSSTVEYTVPSNNPVMTEWDTWVGNSAPNRIWVALSSVVVAGVGLAAPLFFAFFAAIYSLGIAIIMAFAPIMFLFGAWSGKGWEIFKGWGELVINTTMKRIAVGALLALTIALQAAVLKMMETIDWWQGILLLILVSILAIKSKGRIVEAIAGFRFAATNFSASADRLNQQSAGFVKGVSRFAVGSTAGAVASKYNGGTLSGGAAMGFKREMENLAYRSQPLRDTMNEYEVVKNNKRSDGDDPFNGQKACVYCGKRLDFEEDQLGTQFFEGGRTTDGNLMCNECYYDGVDTDASQEYFTRKPDHEVAAEKTALGRQRGMLAEERFTGASGQTNPIFQARIQGIKDNTTLNGEPANAALNTASLREAVAGLINKDIAAHKANPRVIPAVPEELNGYLDLSVLASAWDDRNYDFVAQYYILAWVAWFSTTTGTALNVSPEEFQDSVETTRHNQLEKAKEKKDTK
jgi:hypothetical protein